jgi:ribosomal protein L40E
MATAPDPDDVVEEFLTQRGHEPPETWDRSYNKLQCPDCGALHGTAATDCSVCGWAP